MIDEDVVDEPWPGGDDSDGAGFDVFAHKSRNPAANAGTHVSTNSGRNVRDEAGPSEIPAWQRVVAPTIAMTPATDPAPAPPSPTAFETRLRTERPASTPLTPTPPIPDPRLRAERPASSPASSPAADHRVIRAAEPDRPPMTRAPKPTPTPAPEYEALAQALAGAAPVGGPADANAETQLIPKIEDQGPIPIRGGKTSRRAAARALRKLNRKLRVISGFGEVLISLGTVLALYVVYTLWWTNVTAHAEAHAETNTIQHQLQQQSTNPSAPPKTTFSPSEGFGLMSIPGIQLKDVPVMQGTDKDSVLDKGAIGHYTDPKTAMPWDKTGNFAVAAHRRTHGEPFRYINTLKVGDHVVLETTHGWYVYQLDKELAQTDPSNVGVIAPIPKGGPYTKAGQYLTLTTCTPEWASYYRLIWWGHLVRVDPLSGPPPAELSSR